MNNKTLKINIKVIGALLWGLFACTVNALEFNVQAGYQGEYTNNTAKTDNNKTNEWIHIPRINLNVTQEGPSGSVVTNYAVRREIHQENVFGDKSYVTGDTRLTWQALPQRLSFTAFNSRTESSISTFRPDSQDNRQISDTSGVGAQLTLQSFANQLLQIGYDYSLFNRDRIGSDSKRQNSTASYIVPLSESQTVQLNVTYLDVDFDDPLAPDFVTQIGALQYSSTLSAIDLDVSVGYTNVDRGIGRSDVNGTTGNALLTWRATGLTSFDLSYDRSIQDNSSQSTLGNPSFGQRFTEDSSLSEIFTQSDAQFSINSGFGHNKISLQAFLRDKDYENLTQDERRTGLSLDLSRNLRPTVRARLNVNGTHVDSDLASQDYDEFRSTLSIDWTGFRRLTISAQFAYEKRDGDRSNSNFDEFRGSLILLYNLLRRSG